MICTIEPLRGQLSEQLDDLLKIERANFEFPWTPEEFTDLHKRNRCLPAYLDVALDKNKHIMGYLAFERETHRFNILNIAVDEKHQRRGVGKKLITKLIARLTRTGRSKITKLIRESNSGACEFSKACGFVAHKIVTNPFPNTKEDGFELTYRWSWSPQGRRQEGDPQICLIHTRWCISCGKCADLFKG